MSTNPPTDALLPNTTTLKENRKPARVVEDLPPDNTARIAIYDALVVALTEQDAIGVPSDLLFRQVIGQLRILVPRELHLLGEEAYFQQKVDTCVEHGILRRIGCPPESHELFALGNAVPQIAYPDGSVRYYEAGLEAARERLRADDAALRAARFDVKQFVPSVADAPDPHHFTQLVASMREHGYIQQLPVLKSADGLIVDGRARMSAADVVGVKSVVVQVPPHRDTPLQLILLTLDANYSRIDEQVRRSVHDAVGRLTRPWPKIEEDLQRTQAWRLAEPRYGYRKYPAKLDVRKRRYRPGGPPKVQVTKDGSRVMLRSLLEAAGLASYKYTILMPYVAIEAAQTPHVGGPKAFFVDVDEAIQGIRKMQRDRRSKRLKVDSEWEDMRKWLTSLKSSQESVDDAESIEGSREPS